MMHEAVFLFDVDNTLLDNDRVQADLHVHIGIEHGIAARDRYWEIFEKLRDELGYADYLGALERYRLEEMHDPRLLRISNWLAEYPFVTRGSTRERWRRSDMCSSLPQRLFCRTEMQYFSPVRSNVPGCGENSMVMF